MYSLSALEDLLNQAFGKLRFDGQPKELYEPIEYTLGLGGKRIRPLLVLTGCDLFGGDPEKAIPVAIGMELFHNFTLLHDDIMDQAPLRRGKETVYKKWNTPSAILSGDTLFALAYESILRGGSPVYPDLLQLFTRTAREVCEGQQMDLNFERMQQIAIPDYLEMIRLKTAVLLACSLKAGALLAGAPSEEARKIYAAGENLGMAFQLQDDLLDTYGEEKKFGKEIGGDIISGKKTYLYLSAMLGSGEEDAAALTGYYRDAVTDPADKIRKVKEIFDRAGVKESTLNLISDYFNDALNLVRQTAVPEPGKMNLLELATRLIRRDV
ncbi:MAG TPA: polyprenyl synthetase family protein [Bacteroidales bacterium]|nr:polyprenyl synthetase family protein [Bacteroidales bacterium]